MLDKKTLKYGLLNTVLCSVIFTAGLSAQAISRGYESSDSGLQPGMVVQLTEDSDADNPEVERANIDNADRAIGVATTIEDSNLTIASAGQSVYVETTGEVNAFVSDIDGEVKQGDLLSLSAFNGTLAKHVDGARNVFALALEDAALKSNETYTVQSPDGEKTASLATIRVNLDQKGLGDAAENLSALEKLGKKITGKSVNALRVIVALIIFIIVMIAEGALLYGSISSAVTSIGRNPLTSKTIKRELIKVISVALFAMAIGLGAVYLVLWA